MTLRQKVLRLVYPLLMWAGQKGAKDRLHKNEKRIAPPVSFYSLSVVLNNGKVLPFETLKGKKVLLVNTASDCGYTPQYTELQKLYEDTKEAVEIIAFPANDFKEQEKGNDEEIAAFCTVNYGLSFPVAKKSSVVKGAAQNPVFRWLTDKSLNGWNDQPPSWNFSKYLVDEDGVLTHCFAPQISPLSEAVVKEIV